MYILILIKKSKTFVYNDFTFVVFHLDLFKFTLQHTAAMAQLIDRAFDLHASDRGWISSRNIGK